MTFIDQSINIRNRGQRSPSGSRLIGQPSLGKIRLSEIFEDVWEILVYEHEDSWEACLSGPNGYHHHVRGVSLLDAAQKARHQICELQGHSGTHVQICAEGAAPAAEEPQESTAEPAGTYSANAYDNDRL